MKIAHISDLHFFQFPHWTGIFTKRILGLSNLYIRGRRHCFSASTVRTAIASVIENNPDTVLISGDLTALGSPSEFIEAREALAPLIDRFPVILVPGNHDYYTKRAASSHRIEEYFDDILRSTGSRKTEGVEYPTLHLIGEAAVIGLNPNFYSLAAMGRIQEKELDRLPEILASKEVKGHFPIILMHYPLFNRNATVTTKFWRRLGNREKLLEILKQYRVELLLHGHDHHRYINFYPHSQDALPGNGSGTYMFNSGSAGYKRGQISASYNLYHIENHRFTEVTIMEFNGSLFSPVFSGPPDKAPLTVTD